MSYDLSIKSGDLQIKNGALVRVIDTEKLVQDILKICLTPAGSNPFSPAYGSFISRTLVGSALDSSILIQIGKSQLTTALENLKTLQGLQLKSFQRMSAGEQLATIQDISIFRSDIDPRVFNIQISVLSKGLTRVSTSFRLTAI
jgi:phage baseplate assembly protein W